MTHKLTLELPEDVYQPVKRAAEQSGQTPEEWALARLRAAAPSDDQIAALERLLRHAGAVDLGKPTGIDNVQIDADLANEYGDTHEGRA